MIRICFCGEERARDERILFSAACSGCCPGFVITSSGVFQPNAMMTSQRTELASNRGQLLLCTVFLKHVLYSSKYFSFLTFSQKHLDFFCLQTFQRLFCLTSMEVNQHRSHHTDTGRVHPAGLYLLMKVRCKEVTGRSEGHSTIRMAACGETEGKPGRRGRWTRTNWLWRGGSRRSFLVRGLYLWAKSLGTTIKLLAIFIQRWTSLLLMGLLLNHVSAKSYECMYFK